MLQCGFYLLRSTLLFDDFGCEFTQKAEIITVNFNNVLIFQ